jgi:hypothetical protein
MSSSLSEFLEDAGASAFAMHFRREGFTTVGQLIASGMSQKNLEEMGVSDAEVRNRIIMAMFRSSTSSMGGDAGGSGEPAAGVGAAAQEEEEGSLSLWLAQQGQGRLLGAFHAEGFSSLAELLDAELGEDDLAELGLTQLLPRKAAMRSLDALREEARAELRVR